MNRVGVAVSVGVGPDRRPVAVKRATSPSGAERLRTEAAMLQAARHPQVVEVVGFEPGGSDGQAVLTTGWVPAGSLVAGASRRRPSRDVVRVLASAAATLSDLHDRGIVHGRISADHILVDEHGAAVLCGFAGAEQHSDRPATDDIAAIGELIATLAEALAAPTRHRALFALRRRNRTDLAERLAAIGRRAADPLATRRPSARALARQLDELAPEPARRAADPFARAGRRWRRVVAAGLGALVFVAAAAAVAMTQWRARGAGSTAPPTTSVTSTAAAPVTSTAPVTTAAPTTVVLVAPQPTPLACEPLPPDVPAVDLDGDGCPEPIAVDAAGTVTVGGLSFGIGLDAGDQVVVGDWDCDGRPTLAVLRLPSGTVDVFSGWPADGEPPVVATRVAEVPGAHAVEAIVRNGGPCTDIRVQTPDGPTVVTVVP